MENEQTSLSKVQQIFTVQEFDNLICSGSDLLFSKETFSSHFLQPVQVLRIQIVAYQLRISAGLSNSQLVTCMSCSSLFFFFLNRKSLSKPQLLSSSSYTLLMTRQPTLFLTTMMDRVAPLSDMCSSVQPALIRLKPHGRSLRVHGVLTEVLLLPTKLSKTFGSPVLKVFSLTAFHEVITLSYFSYFTQILQSVILCK